MSTKEEKQEVSYLIKAYKAAYEQKLKEEEQKLKAEKLAAIKQKAIDDAVRDARTGKVGFLKGGLKFYGQQLGKIGKAIKNNQATIQAISKGADNFTEELVRYDSKRVKRNADNLPAKPEDWFSESKSRRRKRRRR